MTVDMIYRFVIDGVPVSDIAQQNWLSSQEVTAFLTRAGFNCTPNGDCGRYHFLTSILDAGQIKLLLSEYATLGMQGRESMSFAAFVQNSGIDIEYLSPAKSMSGLKGRKSAESSKHSAWNTIGALGSPVSSGSKKHVNERTLHFMHDEWSAMTSTVKQKNKFSHVLKVVIVVLAVIGIVILVAALLF